jgi:carbon-monoxide dehydrogenase iron sulfur subunit
MVLHKRQFQELLKKNAMFSFSILKVLSKRIRETSKDISLAKSASYFKGMTIISRPEKCLSCRTCEIACAVAKSRTHHLYEAVMEEPLPVKRIRLRKDESGSEPVVRPEHCIHCKDAPCLDSCKKYQAIKRDPSTRTIEIIEEQCVGCGLCARACPFNVITMIRGQNKKRVALKCTHCREHQAGPACVRSCPTNALVVALGPGADMDYDI